jgi:hypothetical protein
MSSVGIGIVPPLELVTCSHVFGPQLPLNQTCKLSSPNIFGNNDSKYMPFDATSVHEIEGSIAGLFNRARERGKDLIVLRRCRLFTVPQYM